MHCEPPRNTRHGLLETLQSAAPEPHPQRTHRTAPGWRPPPPRHQAPLGRPRHPCRQAARPRVGRLPTREGNHPSDDAWLDGYGTTHTDTLAQSVSVPASCTTAKFSFYLHVDTAETTTATAYDTLKVQVLNSAGTVVATLATYSNLNAASGYTQHSFSLAGYVGQTVTLKFTGSEDSSLQTSFILDDTALTVS